VAGRDVLTGVGLAEHAWMIYQRGYTAWSQTERKLNYIGRHNYVWVYCLHDSQDSLANAKVSARQPYLAAVDGLVSFV